MSGWVEDVLTYGSGPLIAAGAVIVTQVMANRREDRRIAGERAERALDRDHTARVALQERWRDERRAAYQTALGQFDEAIKFGTESVTLMGIGADSSGSGSAHEKLEGFVSTFLPPAVSQVALIASADTATAAKTLHHNLRLLDHALRLADHKGARAALQTCRQLRDDFLVKARADLGTM